MADSSGGSNTADSYIGSLISLTSKSEIRYEGVLYTVDTENSNIALSNVRSFGTEGRKKDGPQILPSEKVYDFIIFRGSDIKDLQVKSSPGAVPASHPSDPAIIHLQSQYPQPASLAPAYVPPSQVGPPTDTSLPAAYGGIRSPALRGSVPPMYQSAAGMGSWGVPPMPGVNGTGIAMPMYWQGYYRPPSGQAQLQPQPLPVPNLTPQHVLQAPGRSYLSPPASVSGVPTGVASSQADMAFANAPPPPMAAMQSYFPAAISEPLSQALFPTSIAASMLVAAPLPSTPVVPPATPPAASAVTSSIISASTAVSGASTVVENVASSAYGVSAVITPAAKNPRRSNAPGQSAITPLQDGGVVGGASSGGGVGVGSTLPVPLGLSASAHGAATKAVWSNASGHKPIGAPQPQKGAGSLESSILEQSLQQSGQQISAVASEELQQQISQPLLPLPVTSVKPKIVPQWHGGQRSAVTRQSDRWQGNGSPGHSNNYGRRPRGRAGSGRGVGVSHPTKQFTEDFDFTAMNERFKKDEVWGELGGKGDGSEKVQLPISVDGVDGNPDDEELDGLALSSKSVPDAPKKTMLYVKEEFFDSLSCDALDREGGRAERTKYSEQRKIDTETFGTSLRGRGGRGGRGGMRGGYRGGGGFYNQQYSGGGRGNGYGRARNAPRTTSPK